MQIGGSSFDIPLPVQLSLPIDELQRRAEELEFSELLDQVRHVFTGPSLHIMSMLGREFTFEPPQMPYAFWVDFNWKARHASCKFSPR